MVFEAYVTNLGKYNEGVLAGAALKFPATAEDVQSVLIINQLLQGGNEH